MEKKTKKHTHTRELTFSLLLFVGHGGCDGVSHCLFPGGLTDRWQLFSRFVSVSYVLGVTLTGSTTDTPLGGVALRHGRAAVTQETITVVSLDRPPEPSETVCRSLHTVCGIFHSYWTTQSHAASLICRTHIRLNTLSVYLPTVKNDKYLLYHKYLYLFGRSPYVSVWFF